MDSAGEKPANFHERLYDSLQMLVEFIHAEGMGLSHDVIKNDDYWRVEQRLQYHKTDTEHLIDKFHVQRLHEQFQLQNSNAPALYGTLTVRAYFNHDSLCVEVLRAANVIPLDPNGFSDPFVIVELLPRRVFSHCNEQQTHVHKVNNILVLEWHDEPSGISYDGFPFNPFMYERSELTACSLGIEFSFKIFSVENL